MKKVTLFTKENCGLCDEVRSMLSLFEVTIEEVDIEKNKILFERYMFEIPVVRIGEEELDYRLIDYMELEKRLQ